jgi:hypothetical protein
VGETRVDLLHLLEDLRDAYPGPTEETVLTEIVANALDSGASTIGITVDPAAPALTIVDDGTGMRRRELSRFHDIASSTKTRGAGIGFAGVGIKIALLVCVEVVTETRRGAHHVASTWGLASRHKAPWRWIPPAGLVPTRGTAVRLVPTNALSPLLDPGFIEGVLRRNFEPFFDPVLATILGEHYARGVTFALNGRALTGEGTHPAETAPIAIRMGRRRKPAATGYLYRDTVPLPEDSSGLAVSTLGKVIKRGWDWLGITPSTPERIGGLIEVPALAECLTLNKADFIRAGRAGAIYLAYRKAIQEAVTPQLAQWGQAGAPEERARRRAARPVERDLEAVLEHLADDFPLLASLVEHRAGGQRPLRVDAGANGAAAPGGSPGNLHPAAAELEPRRSEAAQGPSRTPPGPVEGEEPAGSVTAPSAPPTVRVGAGTLARRRARYGLSIQFERREGDPELAHLVESTVWVNEAHPAYRRAVDSRSEGYHVAVAVALALAPLAVDPAKEHAFITAFLTRWGAAVARRKLRRRRSA